MSQAKIVSRLVGLINFDHPSECPLTVVEPLLSETHMPPCEGNEGESTAGGKQNTLPEIETVFYKANLSQMARQLEGELYTFRHLFERANALQRTNHF
ncbi:MAG: hypothetical protein P8K78_08520 [Pirellulales bacterium]|nr:hypothetical protein [Pirellulales bacterium]